MKTDDEYLPVAIAAAKEAGRIQKLYLGQTHQVEYKGEIDLVTEVDRICEQAVVRIISERFPDHDFLSEESSFEERGSPWKWIIDPLDGTTNYSHGYPFFCVSIGLEVEGEARLGVVYAPVLGELFQTEKGKGAYLNGKRISVSHVDILNRGFLVTGFPYDARAHVDDYLAFFRQFVIKGFAIRRDGSAALNLSYVAAGRFDGYWELKLHPWDTAAGSLMVTEAGGKMTDFKGNPYSIYSDTLLGTNGLIHEEMLRAIQEIESEELDSSARVWRKS